MRKKRVLLQGESALLSSGYGRLSKDICSRLKDRNDIEIFEFCNYGHVAHPFKGTLGWTQYHNTPGDVWGVPPTQEEAQEFNQGGQFAIFGESRIHDAILHCQPDVFLSYLDVWMIQPALNSPYSHIFKKIYVPTVDAVSDNEGWLADYIRCDSIFTYTDFAYNFLKKWPQIPLKGVAGPGVDNKVFCPIANKKQHKQQFGLPPESRIYGTVMRNQRRKLYPDLFEGFAKFLEICKEKNPEAGRKALLYCHTSHPDVGFDLEKLIKQYGLSHKILFTYICQNCGAAFPAFWSGPVRICLSCNQQTCRLPSTQISIQEGALNQIYNILDVYIQYANMEGLGLPAIEAAAAGVHVVCSNYSGPEDFPSKLGASPVKIKAFHLEGDTNRQVAQPDNDDLANVLYSLSLLPDSILAKKGFDARKGALKHYNWDNTINKLCDEIAKMPYADWSSPPRIHQPQQEPQGLNNSNFIQWAIVNVLGEPEKLNTFFAANLLRDLNTGMTTSGNAYGFEESLAANGQLLPCNRDTIKQKLAEMCKKRNDWELKRARNMNGLYDFPKWLKVSVS